MKEKNSQEPRNLDADRRTEHEFDVITFVLAGLLALIVLAAVGYGIFNSSKVATTIPFPTRSSEIAIKATTQTTTDGSAAHRESPGSH
jgi:hypothetical protein